MLCQDRRFPKDWEWSSIVVLSETFTTDSSSHAITYLRRVRGETSWWWREKYEWIAPFSSRSLSSLRLSMLSKLATYFGRYFEKHFSNFQKNQTRWRNDRTLQSWNAFTSIDEDFELFLGWNSDYEMPPLQKSNFKVWYRSRMILQMKEKKRLIKRSCFIAAETR